MAIYPAPIYPEERIRHSVIFQWNARGLQGRLGDFRQRVFKYRFPIIVICEPNLDSPFRLSGYEQFLSDTKGSLSKVLLCIRRDLTYTHHQVPVHNSNEYVSVSVKHKRRTFTVVGGYVPPRGRFDSLHLETIIDGSPGPHIITGDFNAHHHLWGSNRVDCRGRRLADFIHNRDFVTLNDGSPTFIRGVTYSSCLDLALVPRRFSPSVTWCADIETHGSDHIPTYVQLKWFDTLARAPIRCTDWVAFRSIMEDSCVSLSSLAGIEASIIAATRDTTREVSTPNSRMPIDALYENLRAIRRRAERKYRRTQTSADLKASRCAQKRVRRYLEKLSRQRWRSFCAGLDPGSHSLGYGGLFVRCRHLLSNRVPSERWHCTKIVETLTLQRISARTLQRPQLQQWHPCIDVRLQLRTIVLTSRSRSTSSKRQRLHQRAQVHQDLTASHTLHFATSDLRRRKPS